MRALTIHQPYADLIVDGFKKIENRTWRTHYRGLVAIHAGKSRARLGSRSGYRYTFGAIVGIATLHDCISFDAATRVDPAWSEGPECWHFVEPRRIATPISVSGSQGLWVLPGDVHDALYEQLAG